MCGLYCQQGGRTERTDKEFIVSVVEPRCTIGWNAVTDTAVTGGEGFNLSIMYVYSNEMAIAVFTMDLRNDSYR